MNHLVDKYSLCWRTLRNKCTGRGWRWGVVLLLDSLCGIALLCSIDDFSISGSPDDVVSFLDMLLEWLTRNPGGLKLNDPVNMFLAQFFRYHVYLWHTFMRVLGGLPVFPCIRFSAIAGLSMAAAVASDAFTLFTLHILCFEIYANRLFRVCACSLLSLYRLFRGKKMNPLRDRVDGVHLDARQTFLAGCLSVVVAFLSPTILVYFAVFTALRWCLMALKSPCALFELSDCHTFCPVVNGPEWDKLITSWRCVVCYNGWSSGFPGNDSMLLAEDTYPSITILQLVQSIIDNSAGVPSLLGDMGILDVNDYERYNQEHVIRAVHYNRCLLSRPTYQTESVLSMRGRACVVYGDGAPTVAAVLFERGFNMFLLRGNIQHFQHLFPRGLVTTNGAMEYDIPALTDSISIHTKVRGTRGRLLDQTRASRAKSQPINRSKPSRLGDRRAWR